MSILVKIKLGEEFRRISFKEQPTYQEFRSTLQQIFKEEALSEFVIKYKDEEEDLITVSSDIELSEAFAINRNQILRVFLIPSSENNLCNRNTPVHWGVACDGCNKHPIVGPRFKCIHCPDYDLCAQCESNRIHGNVGHQFKKIERPIHHWHRRYGTFMKSHQFQCPRRMWNKKIKKSMGLQKEEEYKQTQKQDVNNPQSKSVKQDNKQASEQQSTPKSLDPLEEHLTLLKEMGFLNEEENRMLLEKNDCNVTLTVRDLLQK
eukprot:TRINITY_DN3003_c0_g3_i4.p1 TRINITY_DN3003_c0_g3~~TRINITY_DN3003_c0_g3_i4.p1  ORF type:complete len:281 (-),score=51.64 TRINITY_DN3003_c0_g3_i4:23-808(-)